MSHMLHRTAIVAVAVSAMLTLTAGAAPPKTVAWRNDWNRAVRDSQESGKPLLIALSAGWCHWCHKMIDQTFSDPNIARRVNENYIPVVVDIDVHRDLYDRVGASGLPTLLVASAELRIYRKITGYQTPEQLTAELDQIRLPKPSPVVEQAAGSKADGSKADESKQAASKPSVEPAPLFNRYCLVSLLDHRTLQGGSREHMAAHKGITLHFASAQHKQTFLDRPERYWPAWSGYCAVSVVDDSVVRPGLPELGAVYRGRLWFFADEDRLNTFLDSPSEYLRLRTETARKD